MSMNPSLRALRDKLEGTLHWDDLHKALYSTDASIYREIPLAVAFPKSSADLRELILFARENGTSLIPRTAGTSLAGQCVGSGIVVDVSRYFNGILEFDPQGQWVRVEPGVVRDELNAFLKPFGYFFGPITSTANRAMIGGMVGNNSSGTTSIKYGVTRDHVLEMRVLLSDGSEAWIGPLDKKEFDRKKSGSGLEARLYQHMEAELSDHRVREAITQNFPHPAIHRRNTGYAVDSLLQSEIFTQNGGPFNFCKLLTGSEGTLAFYTEIKLHVDPLPPPHEVLLCAHFNSLDACLKGTLVAMQHQPFGCELMDKAILDCTKENRTQARNRFFLEGDPAAILLIECRGNDPEEASAMADAIVEDLKKVGLGYAFPKVLPPDTQRVWALRAAGFGVLSDVPGDEKPIEFVEDTAVHLPDLPAYISDFREMLRRFGQDAVYYAHAGAGELHVRPKVNLKSSAGLKQMRAIAEASAQLVKSYRGSLSGEHGDGRVRGEFIPLILGDENYALFKRIKQTWDPQGIFNPGKIVDAPPMDSGIRYLQDAPASRIETVFSFEAQGGILKAAEKCSGSGDCRKLAAVSGGVMCPSYMATREEKDTTRARANALREFLTHPEKTRNVFNRGELKAVMDLCLSCKGCSSECPSNVDMATLKAEFLHQYYQTAGIPARARFFAAFSSLMAMASLAPQVANFLMKHKWTGALIKHGLGIAADRSLPPLSARPLFSILRKMDLSVDKPVKRVYLFCDEFTNYNDVRLGKKAALLLKHLGYEVLILDHPESGRAAISKGLLFKARKLACRNVEIFGKRVGPELPLIGLEPSAILTFRDEYPKLVEPHLQQKAVQLASHTFTVEEFLAAEIQRGAVTREAFTKREARVLLHGHCHQKSLGSLESSIWLLDLPEHYTVETIPSGCCGMAGSFGYEKEHYQVSMDIGELVLFPAVRKASEKTIIAAPGTSCRHQIWDGTGREARHPVEILYDALK